MLIRLLFLLLVGFVYAQDIPNLNTFKTRAEKGKVYNNALVVTDFDGAGAGTNIANYVNNALVPIAAKTNNWDTAFGWGDHAGLYRNILWVPTWAEVTGKPEVFTPDLHTHPYTAITNAPWLTEYTETDEAALAALAAYAAYWPPDSTPSQYFSFETNNNAITITGYDEAGGADVRIPSYINGWPVKVIGDWGFWKSDIESVHGDVVTIGDGAFFRCPRLTTATFPQATTIGVSAFSSCPALATATCPQATTIGDSAFSKCNSLSNIVLGTDATNFSASAFNNISANPTITISNPHAKGWGETFAGLAVVRPEITADAFTLNGDTITEWPEGGGGLDDFGDWQTFSSASATPTLTVTGHQPIRATLTGGDVTLTVTGLDSPLPVYVTIQGADSLTIASAQWVGGAFYDTARVNHYIVWAAGGALFCQPVATTEVQ